ncbi:hypothetical protein H5410_020471 [Solanum commersonii]|uniref:Uncharacterized protein n=1 Tax=Solanum commersonii TaxID=4109 RepID=A0A9J5ZE92_SOLCO|nr:hypothetical protein H5410_020471 [Solanum commersonii]
MKKLIYEIYVSFFYKRTRIRIKIVVAKIRGCDDDFLLCFFENEKIDSVREQSDPYLGGATRMEGYLATGACSHGDDSNLSYRITNPSFNCFRLIHLSPSLAYGSMYLLETERANSSCTVR